jgi:hypothetical protein
MRKPILIFLFAIFLVLAFYILTYGTGIYTSSRSYTEQQTKNLLCSTFFDFELKNTTYQNGVLAFNLARKSETGEPFSYITIKGEEEKNITVLNMLSYDIQPVSIEIKISKNFTVYPESCRVMSKTFTVQ